MCDDFSGAYSRRSSENGTKRERCSHNEDSRMGKANQTSTSEGIPRLIAVDASTFDTLPCCGIKDRNHPGRREKGCWLRENARFGLQAKALLASNGQPCGYLESIPGEFAWRGVDAAGYLFIHCIWIYSKQHQHKGWGSILVQSCLEDAENAGMKGVAVMVRKGPWMADRHLFLANGFEAVDTVPPDYELLAQRFSESDPWPSFKGDWEQKIQQYGHGLTIIRSSQCPHIAKFAADITETAENEYHIKPRVIDLKSWSDAQQAPTPYAVFEVIYDGRLLADHQISRTRFRNIMDKIL
jgi:ribosomal protein S18 acetylase RimI-like enzyme